MTEKLAFDASRPASGMPERVGPGIVRLIADNPGPYTFTGVCSYVIGHDALAVVDPGPDNERHLEGLVALIHGRPVTAILLTHTHKDHSPLSRRLAAVTGAPILSAGPHALARPAAPEELAMSEASADLDHVPDRILVDGERLTIGDLVIECIATPGHTLNHLCFALPEERLMLSGDHVMGWSTSIVAPPRA